MRRTFRIFFERPEPIIDWEIDVPEDWDERDWDEQREWLNDRVSLSNLRYVEVEEFDEDV